MAPEELSEDQIAIHLGASAFLDDAERFGVMRLTNDEDTERPLTIICPHNDAYVPQEDPNVFATIWNRHVSDEFLTLIGDATYTFHSRANAEYAIFPSKGGGAHRVAGELIGYRNYIVNKVCVHLLDDGALPQVFIVSPWPDSRQLGGATVPLNLTAVGFLGGAPLRLVASVEVVAEDGTRSPARRFSAPLKGGGGVEALCVQVTFDPNEGNEVLVSSLNLHVQREDGLPLLRTYPAYSFKLHPNGQRLAAAPRIDDYLPYTGAEGDRLWIHGEDFPPDASVTVAGVAARVYWRGGAGLHCLVPARPPAQEGPCAVRVWAGNLYSEAEVYFTYRLGGA